MEGKGREDGRPRTYSLCLEAEFNLGEMGQESRGNIWGTGRFRIDNWAVGVCNLNGNVAASCSGYALILHQCINQSHW